MKQAPNFHLGIQRDWPAAADEASVAVLRPAKERRFGGALRRWLLSLLAAAAFVFLVCQFLGLPIRVQGNSMNDTLTNGELMLVTKPEYLFGDPQVGDVVICRYPGRKEFFVKRLMGAPGDVIEVRENTVYRNGDPLSEPYLTPDRNNDGFCMEPFTLETDEYFVMGDNRNNSHDSRNYYGSGSPVALTRDQIVGHVRYILFPFGEMRAVR